MDNFWRPKSIGQKIWGTVIIWFVGLAIGNIFITNKVSDIYLPFLLILMVTLTVWIWVVKTNKQYGEDYEVAYDPRIQQAVDQIRKSNGSYPTLATRLRYLSGGVYDKEQLLYVAVRKDGLLVGAMFIPIKDIKSVNVETELQLSSRLTAEKLVQQGIYTITPPPPMHHEEAFLMIDYIDGFNSTLVLSGTNVNDIHAELLKCKEDALKKPETDQKEKPEVKQTATKQISQFKGIRSLITLKLRYFGGGAYDKEKVLNVTVKENGLVVEGLFFPIEDIKAVNLETQFQLSNELPATKKALLHASTLVCSSTKQQFEKFLVINYTGESDPTLILGGKNITKIHGYLLKIKKESLERLPKESL